MPVQSKDYGSILWNHYCWCKDNGRDTTWWFKPQASIDTSHKRQAPSTKAQASSHKQQGPGSRILHKV